MAGKRPKVSSGSGTRSIKRKNFRFLMLALLLAAIFSVGLAAVLLYVNTRQPAPGDSQEAPVWWAVA